MRNVRIFNSVIAVGTAMVMGSRALAQGQVVGWGQNAALQSSPTPRVLLPVSMAEAGDNFSLLALKDGTVVGFGSNVSGQSAPPSGLSGVTQVSAGGSHSLALTSSGSVIAWGAGKTNGTFPNHGQSIVPSGLGPVAEVSGGYAHSLVRKVDGTVQAWGYNTSGQCNVPAGLATVVKISAGYQNSYALKADGALVGWGANQQQQLNFPATPINAVGVAAGSLHVAVLKSNGTVAAWGLNNRGQCLGTSASGSAISFPSIGAGTSVVLGGVLLTDAVQITAGNYFTAALRANGTVAVWGYGNGGTVSWGSLTPPAGLAGVAQISASSFGGHILAVQNDGTTVAWGDPTSGQTAVPNELPELVQVDGGSSHSLGVKSDGTVIAWGTNNVGQGTVPAGLVGVSRVEAGWDFSLALRSNGTVVGWGSNTYGQLNIPSTLSNVVQIASGWNHVLALKADGTAAGWGLNGTGQATVPAGFSGGTCVAAGYYHSLACNTAGAVTAWGGNISGETVVPAGLSGVTSVVAGDGHSTALRANGTVAAWGKISGQSAALHVPANLTGVVQIACGTNSVWGLKSDGSVVGWGGVVLTGSSSASASSVLPTGLSKVTSIGSGANHGLGVLASAQSRCSNSAGSGLATVAVSGASWRQVSAWNWSNGGGPQVPGALTSVDLGTYGCIGSDCAAQASTLTARSGTSLVVPASASVAGNDYSIHVGNTAALAGRLWLLGVDGAGATLPEDLDLAVLSAGTVSGNFELLQTEVPPPPGFFLTLVPEDVNGRTVLSLRVLPLPGSAELAAGSTGTYSGQAVAAETIDINHDGFDDLALAVDFGAAQPGLIQILLNDGAGGLGGTSVLTSVPSRPTCLAVGDVDGDGDRDVAIGVASDQSARVYLDNGVGGLAVGPVLTALGGTPVSIAILPGSGTSLAATAGSVVVGTSNSKIKIFENGVLQQEIALAGTPTTMRPGKTDVIRPTGINTGGTRTASINGLLPVAETGFVQTLTRAPSGLFEIRQTLYLTAKPVGMDVADLDGDGLDDIVTTNVEPVAPTTGSALPVLSIFRNSGGTFGGGVPYQPATASSGLDVSLIDVDNDGDRDIVSVYKRVGSDSEAALLRVDTLGPGTPISIGQATVLDASDPILSARGNLDGSGGEDLFLVNQPSGAFLTGTQEVKPFVSVGGPLLGDLDGDGAYTASDVALLLLDFGPCLNCSSDLDGSGEVDGGDLGLLLLMFE